jgi:orotate phosphoribosyltransferase
VNFRTLTEDAYLTDKLSDYVIAYTKDSGLSPDCYYGVPEGATKLAVITQYKWAHASKNFAPGSHALPMGRGKPKEHGNPKDRFFLGMPKGKTIVLEDVTTTGGSLLATIDTLRAAGVNVIAALGLANRMELRDDGKTVEGAVKEKGVSYLALSNASGLLPLACKKLKPKKEIMTAIEDEFRRYGSVPIKLG